jgi:predicted dehydrogenase
MTNRRTFLKTSAALAATALSYNRIRGANEALSVGLIGIGGRCQHLLKSLVTIKDVRIIQICDIWDARFPVIQKMLPAKAAETKVYKEVLDNKEVHAVLIASPDHWHVPMTVDACNAGKDVYVEKPLTHDLTEGKAVVEAQNRNNKIVQVGTQQRSMPHIQKGYELVKAGRLGKIHKVHLSWNRNSDRLRKTPLNIDPKSVDWQAFLGHARKQEFDEYRFRNWRWFWDFGGGLLTDLMVHWIDVVHWYLDLDHPQRAVTSGTYPLAKGIWETPDTIQTLLTYHDDLLVHFEGTFSNNNLGAMVTFMGENGTLYVDRGRYEFTAQRGRGKDESLVLSTEPKNKGADFYDKPDGELLHLTNWIECVGTRKKPTAPAEAGVSAASAAHLGNMAYRKNIVAEWDKVNS